jgi:hypothetical protein
MTPMSRCSSLVHTVSTISHVSILFQPCVLMELIAMIAVDDPIFSAHQFAGNYLMPGYDPFPIYMADYPATVLGCCIDQYRYCNQRLKRCSSFVPSHYQDDVLLADLTENKGEMYVALLMRIYTSLMMNLYWQTNNNLEAVLSINDNIFSGSVGSIAREQWKNRSCAYL